MRYYPFLVFLLTTSAFADCQTSDIPPDGPYTCVGTLFIDTPLTRRNPDDITSLTPLDITADNVVITANITLDGAPGTTASSANENGGLAGPGATNGGSLITSIPTSGGLGDPQDGNPGGDDPAVCASGAGGGGGLFEAGTQGLSCVIDSANTPGAAPGGNGGLIVPFSLIGGYGGGAGGKDGSSFDVGTGGGGGGAIRIEATSGNITIANGVRISARGGRGGNSASIGGAGGGGGGGLIYLVSPTTIINRGVFDVRGGDPGLNNSVAFPQGGNGGRGGNGLFILEENSIQTSGSGLQDFSSGLSSSTSSLKSDISCGTIAKKNDNSMMFQMFAGFALAAFASVILRRKTRS